MPIVQDPLYPKQPLDAEGLYRLRIEHAQLQKDAARLEGEVASLKKSLSWRISAPIRSVFPHAHAEGAGSSAGESGPKADDPRMIEIRLGMAQDQERIRRSEAELASLKASLSWRITQPLRWVDQFLFWNRKWMFLVRQTGGDQAFRIRLALEKWRARIRDGRFATRVVYVSGAPETAGHHYRVDLYASALSTQGYDVHVVRIEKALTVLPLIESADVVVIWRAEWGDIVQKVFRAARRRRRKVVFDVDDLIIDPSFAKIDVVDGIRSGGFDERAAAAHFSKIRETLLASDCCTASTDVLGAAIRQLGKTVFVLPNGFDERTFRDISAAAEARRALGSDGLIRLGYAGGSRTHQKDFAQAAPAVARILREHPNCRLIAFRKDATDETQRFLDVAEYPEFAGLEFQIEWRLTVPLRQLPSELVRFDINLAPVEKGNIFCEAKSELKYFEAALGKIPTVASPTDPFAKAMRDGETGFLAANPDEWYSRLKRLVMEPELRRQIGHAAFFDVIWKYGPERRAQLAALAMKQALYLEASGVAGV